MLRLITLLSLVVILSACGSAGQVYGDHVKLKVTYKDVGNIIYGTFRVPSGKSIVSIQLSSDTSFTRNVITAQSCLEANFIPSDAYIITAPTALFCNDNSFYFSNLTSNAGVVRATLTDGNYLFSYFSAYTVKADVTITVTDDWLGESGSSITFN